jgi:hypothetical protein
MKALVAQDREAFYAAEIAARERTGYPPFGPHTPTPLYGRANAHQAPGVGSMRSRARTPMRCAYSGPRKHHSRSCADVIGFVFW